MKFRYTKEELANLSDNELLSQLITERTCDLNMYSPLKIRLEKIQNSLVELIKKDLMTGKCESEIVSIWSHISPSDVEGVTLIDAWLTDDQDEEGITIARVHSSDTEYLDKRAKTDCYAQEIIKQIIRKRFN